MAIKFDDVLLRLGMGRWNLPVILIISYWTMNVPSHTLGGAFLAPAIDVTCILPDHGLPKITSLDGSNQTTVDQCVYLEETKEGALKERPCTQWYYDNSTFITTITSEFNLVCEHKVWRATFQSIYLFGLLVGSSINGFFSDTYGRKRMLAVATVVYCTLAICISWIPDLSAILVARFIMGVMHPTSNHSGYTLAMEMTKRKYRALVGTLIFFPWGLGTILWGGNAYLIREWRWLQLAVSLPALLFLPSLWFMDESPRWLIVQGQHDRALKVLEKAARLNKATLPPRDQLLTMMQNIASEAESVPEKRRHQRGLTKVMGKFLDFARSYMILVRTRRMRRYTLAMYVCFTVTGLGFYGLSLSGSTLGINLFVFMALSGTAELPGKGLSGVIVERFGRRNVNIICYALTALSLLAVPFVPTGSTWLIAVLSLLGKITISFSYTIIFLHCAECFPTEARTRGLGTSTIMAQVGSVCAAFVVEYLGSVAIWAPSVLFGMSSLVASAVMLTLPETRGAALHDTVVTLEARPSNSRSVRKKNQMRKTAETTLRT
ncbi:organic cation transporter protein-like isoform X1 [Homarus americanus]|uniref:organic cation transporter protein-like isoform X1 n=1 Tax=Homarus americanus TaxID=6706 RepID=UPI001C45F964|nr:organic cation transporter protein-like isoform X1 [Homarus americanus]XP_042242973.1 organic cation transporter protein-like isoform X1 [Homarus americanus]XP_042242974.1 organic cation transporter protein-like isoform X1 [Homarus americanus]